MYNSRLTSFSSLTELLAKDSNNRDPARVINISSIAAFSPKAEGASVAAEGNGLWSCELNTISRAFVLIYF